MRKNYLIFLLLLAAVTHGYALLRVAVLLLKSRSWVQVCAEVQEVSSKSLAGGVEAAGLGSTGKHVRQMTATYTYTYNGMEYVGNGMVVLDAAKIFSAAMVYNFDRILFDRLNKCKSQGNAIVAWVDPSRPERSILSRRIYVGRLLYLISIVAGSFWGFLLLV
jgi:hypothetical protein